jgi:hypothetical protein
MRFHFAKKVLLQRELRSRLELGLIKQYRDQISAKM